MVLNPHAHSSRRRAVSTEGELRLTPLARALAVALATAGAMGVAQARQAFSPAWFADKGAAQAGAVQSGRLPNGMPASSLTNPGLQQQQANAQLQRSISNLNLAAQAIAAQQAAQAAAREAARNTPSSVPDGLTEGGLAVDTNSLTAGWHNANRPEQTPSADGRTHVAIQQTGDRAVLNWETFNVGRNTTVDFKQQADWAALNRVNDPKARPSQIQGQIKADGTVLIANRNGIVFSGTSQTDTRNLVAAAAHISDDQFKARGIHSALAGEGYAPSFTDAQGAVKVEAGAQLTTRTPASVTQGGGYVLLMGKEVHNAGTVTTPRGQAQLAAGDFFIVRPGQGTAENTFSTTRGNEVAPQFLPDSTAGQVSNTGLLRAPEGDITLAGRKVVQDGVALATTTVDTRGTIHLLASAADAKSSVTVTGRALNAVLLDTQDGRTALDSQRSALINESARQDVLRRSAALGAFDNLAQLNDRRDLSRIEIVSGGGVLFEGASTTLATGGQIVVSAGRQGGRSTVADGARLDVSGAVGVRVAMASNNVEINIQGNEQRDAPVNRDTTMLNNSNVWIDRRKLTRVAAGTGGYDGERWYTAGGLLEVGGYLGLQGHSVGEWAAQGGHVVFTGAEVVTQAGSNINLSGGTLDVQTGVIRQSWLKGRDGRLYEASSAPADIVYTGVYKGFEDEHKRWGDKTTGYFYNPLIGPQQRLENGYTVGRDAGRLEVATGAAVLRGDITATAYQGPGQGTKSDAALDGYAQSHYAAARAGQLTLGNDQIVGYNDDPTKGAVGIFRQLVPTLDRIVFADGAAGADTARLGAGDPLPAADKEALRLDSRQLSGFGLGALVAVAGKEIAVDGALGVAPGGRIALHATTVAVRGDLTARGGQIMLGNVVRSATNVGGPGEVSVPLAEGTPPEAIGVRVAPGVTLDARGLWSNLQMDPSGSSGLPYLDGGAVRIRTTGAIDLAAGSLIDVSSGGAVLANGKTRGGRGGDVDLLADSNTSVATHGLLHADGDIRGYGVSGGGTLRMASGTGVVIGGEALGERAATDLILLEDYQVKAGSILPVDYHYQRTRALPGETLGSSPFFDDGEKAVTIAADWTLPRPKSTRGSYAITAIVNGASTTFRSWGTDEGQEPVTVPAGARIVWMSSVEEFPISFVVPAAVFPNGLSITAQPTTVHAGQVAPADFTIASGTRVAAGTVFNRPVTALAQIGIDSGILRSGFSRYDINGHLGLVVADGAKLDVRMPVYRFAPDAKTVAGGSEPERALALWMPPLWTEDPVRGVLTQRGGASLQLQALVDNGVATVSRAPVDVRPGAEITVDAGQSIGLRGREITVDGLLRAPGGTISVEGSGLPGSGQAGSPGQPGLVWIGERAVLDASARAAVAYDNFGRAYGQVPDGGTIRIGGAFDWEQTGLTQAPEAFVVIRPGALLDASGTRADLDPGAGGPRGLTSPVPVASNGGTIVLSSSQGLYLDGTLRAAAGGAGAAGGTLALALESAIYPTVLTTGELLRHRELVLAQTQGDSPLAVAASRFDARQLLRTGTGRIGVDRIEAGGFDNLSLLVHGPLSFDGDVALNLGQSLRLYAASYAHSDAAAAGSSVSLSAPYVRLAGVRRPKVPDDSTMPEAGWAQGPSTQVPDGTFAVAADLIDVRDRVGFGARATVELRTSNYAMDRRGFAAVELTSRGDIRLLGGMGSEGLTDITTELATAGNLALTAAQAYPATDASARILAGVMPRDPASGETPRYAEGSVLAIRRHGDGEVATPYSAFGSLRLGAETIEQGGILRAPLGRLQLGSNFTGEVAERVTLLAGSETSVSGAGLQMPYGGTVDGLSYRYGGQAVTPVGAGGMEGSAAVRRGIGFNARHVDAQAGSLLDLSGGGTLSGAGFATGRGGSVDVLATPLANANPFNGYSDRRSGVYAIVPGSAASYAPVAPEAGFGAPGVGQQVTLPAGVPGLPAGTYTLMPSTYALLPGAFRVEIGAGDRIGLSGVTGVGNGSYVAPGYLGVAHTAIRETLPNRLVLTPGTQVRAHSSYSETDYNTFMRADATRQGFARGMLTVDAKTLDIFLAKPTDTDTNRLGFTFDGQVRLDAAPGTDGFGGTVNVRGLGEVLAAGQTAATGLAGASVQADELSKLHAPRLVLNGGIAVKEYGQRGRLATIDGDGSLVVRSGARLSAGDIVLASSPGFVGEQQIVIEEGASLSTLGQKASGFDSSAGYVFTGTSVLALSNGWLNLQLGASSPDVPYSVGIHVGQCVTASCSGTTQLVSEGTLAIATNGALTLADNVSYGTRNLSLAVAAVNLGEDAAIATAGANGRLPLGLALNQARLDRLLAGNTAIGAPALETLIFNARDAVNIFGAVKLDASGLDRLVFGTPAIHGYGAAGDVASIRAGEFVWSGSNAVPGAAMADLLGAGTLDIGARTIVLGHGPYAQPSGQVTDARLALGFADVKLNASERVTSSGRGTLAVHQRQGAYTPGEGYAYEGGNLAVVAPVLTGQAASTMRITAGGDITVAVPEGVAPGTSDALGATLELRGKRVGLEGSIVLPSGRLVLAASDNVTLGAASRIDLSGRTVTLFDVAKDSAGGELLMTSAAGHITQAAGGLIDVSAHRQRGGTIEAVALGEGAGHVALDGALRGATSGSYDAGGTLVPYDAGELTVRARTLSDFAGLNQRLNDGGVFGARRFQIKQGDLVVGDGVKAREVAIALDGGSLRVDGRIDASGVQVGTIRLAAAGDLRVNGTLDAHGTGLRVDSAGRIIDSPNRAVIDLTSRDGTLTLGSGARIDLRAGTDVPVGTRVGQNDGRARGTLDLNAPRLGADDVAVVVEGTPTIVGAKTVAVNAFRTYDDAPLATTPDVTGHRPQLITQDFLNKVDVHSVAFIDKALGNASLSARLAGLGSYHLRPGVEIVSDRINNPNGDLTVDGDLDLSGYRYGPAADRGDPARRGFGEPGKLVIRAAGALNVHGSISDGFAPPPATPDDVGWMLAEGRYAGGDVVVPIDGVTLDSGTRFPAGATLNYSVSVNPATLPAGTVLPVDAVLQAPWSLPAGTVVAANIYSPDGSLAHAAGSVLATAVTLPPQTRLSAGTALRTAASVGALTWPKGVELPVEMTMAGPLQLARGALIPSNTSLELPGNTPVQLRPTVDGVQGRNWAIAPMLGEGATSWDLQLVAGADLGAADRRATRPDSRAALQLADAHSVLKFTIEMGPGNGPLVWAPGNWLGRPPGTPVEPDDLWWCDIGPGLCVPGGGQERAVGAPNTPAFSVLRTGTGDLELLAAGDLRMRSPFGVYTAGTATATEADHNRPRGSGPDGLLGPQSPLTDYNGALSAYRAWYPDQGGNLLIAAGGDLVGHIVSDERSSVLAGNWLWRQGSGTAGIDSPIPSAWWINFGAYIGGIATPGTFTPPTLAGFTGFGTLGGGNLSVRVAGDAGAIAPRTLQPLVNSQDRPSSGGLVLAVASTGRVGADGALTLTGGGDIDMRVAGALNPHRALNGAAENLVLTGAIANLRGSTDVRAASIGSLGLQYLSSNFNLSDPIDTRAIDPFNPTFADARGGINLLPGDATMRLSTRGDLVLGAAADPGRVPTPNTSAFSVGGTGYDGGGQGWFSLWSDRSAIDLLSAGGHLTPVMARRDSADSTLKTTSPDAWIVYPGIFHAAALTGNIYAGYAALPQARYYPVALSYGLTLAPSARGEFEMLSGGSIYAGQLGMGMSGTGTPLPTPFNPAFFAEFDAQGVKQFVTNASPTGTAISGSQFFGPSLFAFGPNTAAQPLARDAAAPPVRFYAASGDIVGLRTGETLTLPDGSATWYHAAGPIWIKAGRDIVNTGDAPGTFWVERPSELQSTASRGNLIVHQQPSDVSVISAGRDILYANVDIAGPGTLEVSAGRHLRQEDRGGITSIGPIVPGDTRPGASVALMAGVGAQAATQGLDMAPIRARYLDPSNRAETGTPLAQQPGKAAKTYEAELAAWLKARYGFDAGTTAQALAYFDGLAPAQQRIFLREVYYAELREGGREYNDADGPRQGSYLRGREMIATLFPARSALEGDITMFGGSGVRTQFGGDIDMLAPGGSIILGVQGAVPPATSGVLTQGQGNIRFFSEGSLLLGLSRIMTTFGGSILAWSEKGDINAGRGAKTTVVFTPPKRVYDNVGNVEVSPQAPSSGAGIATLAPIAEVPPGDVDLIAPLGTIDAGEAGIRVSGNVNVAALQVVNAANIQVKGESAGLPVVASVNVGALTNASAAASQASMAAQDVMQRERAAARQALPSVFTVRVLGFGNEPASGGAGNGAQAPADGAKATTTTAASYNPRSVIRVLGGGGTLPPAMSRQLTDEERANLQR
ncbi:filamentous hemagglutinin family protein [Variovorax boronicumulans]|uniref:Filamentous hemagglutinin family protein n=1 Tax=Variovorax boronicumulans TaxID=436515 RepID=A0AAW8E4S0_9BURK|nr:filamentous haemagglutinin family protein [Variovorax boronicumulans]MDP9881268.1 filamentous hemagglutinin family protein [Variovorax boronicumulans]MDP9926555.1 filamentous hemagglutinin family protein [Variovorax boronicumulans]